MIEIDVMMMELELGKWNCVIAWKVLLNNFVKIREYLEVLLLLGFKLNGKT